MKEYKKGGMKAFARAAQKQTDLSANDFIDAILEERPDLKDEMVYVPEQGKHGYTVFIGNEVFKGPNAGDSIDKFDKECAFLQNLKDKSLPVPRITCVGKKNVFYGMTRLKGVALARGFEQMADEEKCKLAEDIMDFAVGMAKALPSRDGTYASHGDLHTENVLVDPVTKRLACIIDFGYVDYVPKADLARNIWLRLPMESYLERAFSARKGKLPDSAKTPFRVKAKDMRPS